MPNFHSNCFEGEGSTCALLFSLTVPTTCFIRLYATPLCSVPNTDRNCRDTADDWPAPPRITIGQDVHVTRLTIGYFARQSRC